MKEAQIFENWINQLSEGTWALPDTPEAQEKLNQLMSGELIVGPDATNATEQLYDIIGDDELFDILNDLADRSEGRANIWDDSDVQARLAELGIQTPQSTEAEPADVPQDTAPPEPSMKEGMGILGEINPHNYDSDEDYYDAVRAARGKKPRDYDDDNDEMPKDDDDDESYYEKKVRTQNLEGVAEGDNLATFVESNDLAYILKHAGVPIKEAVLRDDTGNTWDHLIDRFRHEVEQFKQGHELDSDLYDALFDYYMQHGAMPYGVAKGRTGDPFNWVSDRLADDLGMNENLIAPMAMPVTTEGSTCNMTAEGAYCPEHGLAECGSMYEDGGAVGMPYSMGEGTDDPINSNSAMTGSYYESKDGDALLARIKSLALIK